MLDFIHSLFFMFDVVFWRNEPYRKKTCLLGNSNHCSIKEFGLRLEILDIETREKLPRWQKTHQKC